MADLPDTVRAGGDTDLIPARRSLAWSSRRGDDSCRPGTGSDEPFEAAALALRAGEMVMIAPQGTIPRGPAFFEPELKGRWGGARLAAMTGAPVIPIGLWGTEQVWPRNARLPRIDPLRCPM